MTEDMVNHPRHYTRGPLLRIRDDVHGLIEHRLECIDVIRHIRDGRLFSAMKYVWRVAFGGKAGTDDREDIQKAIWYLNDWLDNPLPSEPLAVLTVDGDVTPAKREALAEAWREAQT